MWQLLTKMSTQQLAVYLVVYNTVSDQFVCLQVHRCSVFYRSLLIQLKCLHITMYTTETNGYSSTRVVGHIDIQKVLTPDQ